MMTVSELFDTAGLKPRSPVPWRTPVDQSGPGVYVVALVEGLAVTSPAAIDVQSLPPAERARWIEGQPVIYIGRATRSLRTRIAQFYRHKHGERAPHRGGQAVIPLACPRWVYWATTDSPMKAERTMIEAFRSRVGALPYANRRR